MDLGSSFWRQREEIRAARRRILELRNIVGAPNDLNTGLWPQLYALAIEFTPDLILDLGRGYGNSTCALNEAANRLGNTRVVSIGFRDDHAWAFQTEPRLRNTVASSWFEPLEVIEQDIRRIDFQVLYGSAERILVFWDMLGYGVSRCILDNVLPPLTTREHLIVVKDLTDARYHYVDSAHRMADLLSPSNEVRELGGFLLRNGITPQTAEHALRIWCEKYPDQAADVAEAWGEDSPQPGPTQAWDWISFELPSVLRPAPNVFNRIRQLVPAGR